ncbi:hypothetical protein QYF36_021071 [Acer negundo]|nr:hypothetical protein QYF36_021071 [Acer negundo]
MIIRALSNSIDVCICCATTGAPFISTLVLRPLNLSMYATDFEDEFFLKIAARINFGAPSKDAIRTIRCSLGCPKQDTSASFRTEEVALKYRFSAAFLKKNSIAARGVLNANEVDTNALVDNKAIGEPKPAVTKLCDSLSV